MRWSDKIVYICCGHTDMRKSINGLMTLVKDSFSLDPFSEALFVFCNRSRDRLKILEWDFRWPAKGDTATMVLNVKELSYLVEGAKLEKKLKREEVFERQIS